ncbi:SWIB/MDM2 domain-containing protein [Chlamydiifrater volucris]|uniref:SWIB/MDM2 domain-containing protein n=1 Tax=Chlamydiifrater volucris TaxID=2681470 RepID=UPI001BCCB07C|nr:SWIB/MDM2 domain-containing protein [Chlamydiifrater volucris]
MSQNKNSAFMQPVKVSAELAAIVGNGPMPRTDIIKRLWEYIKKNGRQDPKNKRNILPDEKLAKVFGTSAAIDMFEMTKRLSVHIVK